MDVFYIITIKDGEKTATQTGYFRGPTGHQRYRVIYGNVVKFADMESATVALYVIEDLPDGFSSDQSNYLTVDGWMPTPGLRGGG